MMSASTLKNLAIIPARSGSKGLPGKNIKLLHNKPMLAYTIEAALQSNCFNNVIVSTDDENIASIASQYGANIPFIRPQELASDSVSMQDVLSHALGYFEEEMTFNVITLLQPTSPLRNKEDIRKALEIFIEKDADSVVSLCKTEHSPLWMNTLPSDTLENFLRPQVLHKNRQELPIYYRLNGAIYIIKAELIKENRPIFTNKSYPYIMPRERSIDVDDALDFYCCEAVLLSSRNSSCHRSRNE